MTHETTAPVQSLVDEVLAELETKPAREISLTRVADLIRQQQALIDQQGAPVAVLERAREIIDWMACRADVCPKDMRRLEESSAELHALLAAAPTPPAQQPVAWISVEEPFHGTAGIEAGEWDIQCDGESIDKLAAANSPGRIPLYAAPPAPEQDGQPAGTTSDKYRAELYDEVWQKARDMGYANVTDALVALERVKVPRELLARITRNGGVDTLLAIDELRDLLRGSV